MPRSRWRSLASAWGSSILLGVPVLAAACGDEPRAPPFQLPREDGGGAGGSTDSGPIVLDARDGPPPVDAPGFCGNDLLPITIEKPNLYFVIDRSGSMAAPVAGVTRYAAVRQAIDKTLLRVGHRVQYGAAVYPRLSSAPEQGCEPGQEVFPTTEGDPPSYGLAGLRGPVLTRLRAKLASIAPSGGTPTAATLAELTPLLGALPGRTFVVLATDGAPNCNPAASCDAAHCLLNVEGYVDSSLDCTDPRFNCCDPRNVLGGAQQCVDEPASVAAITALKTAGIPTYVIGLPGTELYAGVLDAMAEAGGTARQGDVKYYPTSSQAELESALRAIGVSLTVSCTVELKQPPPDPQQVNVYFDQRTVPSDPLDGWSWVSDRTLELHGAACEELKSGDVGQVQVVAGCPTQIQ